MISKIKFFLRKTQGFLERNVLGGFIQELSWKWKHLYDKGWTETSLNSIELDHRKNLIKVITTLGDINSIMEIGCASAPNLRLARDKLPNAKLVGIDINKKAIKTARNYFLQENDNKTEFFIKSADNLDDFQDNSFDVLFSQAVLVFVPPSNIRKAIHGMTRISKKYVVLNEYHLKGEPDGLFDGGRWVYDYSAIIKEHFPKAEITMQASGFKGGIWDNYGNLIIVKINK
jgi:hypothetical protein